jgi:glycosyltransferase involved in cell wall biosynthesis
VYALNIVRALSRMETDLRFTVYVNRLGYEHLRDLETSEGFRIRVATARISPDGGFTAHGLRFLYSNMFAARWPGSVVFNTSQLEASLFPSRQVITVHDLIPLLLREHDPVETLFHRFVVRSAVRRCPAVITPSRHTASLLQEHLGVPQERCHPIPHGIQAGFFAGPSPEQYQDAPYILYVGRLGATKNVQRLIEAFERIQGKISHRLILAGEGERPPTTLPPHRVTFKGHVPFQELIELYRHASLFVFPSLYEGFGLPPLEAMASGCPVVVSRAGSLPEVCGEAALYVDPYDVGSISQGMHRVLTDDGLQENLIARGLEQARLYTWERSAREHLRILESVARGGKPSPSVC